MFHFERPCLPLMLKAISKALEGDQRVEEQLKLAAKSDKTKGKLERGNNDEDLFGLSRAVIEIFFRLREDVIIYHANRLVNWCVKLNTTLSNLEAEEIVLSGRTLLNVPGYDLKEKFEFGVMISFAYFIEDSDERIIVATTRPETMLGDTVIAIHSKDVRYTHLHGKYVIHPFLDRRIPIVIDVDIEFGTGAVKITPPQDANDYEVGKRHNLEFINILNDDDTFNSNAGTKFTGMKRYHARDAVIQALRDTDLYVETKDHPMEIKICNNSGDVIESLIKPQWCVRCLPLAEEAMKRTRAGEYNPSNRKTSGFDYHQWETLEAEISTLQMSKDIFVKLKRDYQNRKCRNGQISLLFCGSFIRPQASAMNNEP